MYILCQYLRYTFVQCHVSFPAGQTLNLKCQWAESLYCLDKCRAVPISISFTGCLNLWRNQGDR